MKNDNTQSKVNALKARIEQMKSSHLFSEKEKETEIQKLNNELKNIYNEEIQV